MTKSKSARLHVLLGVMSLLAVMITPQAAMAQDPPANDDRANAEVVDLTRLPAQVSGNTRNATVEADEPAVCRFNDSGSRAATVWYSVTPNAAIALRIDAANDFGGPRGISFSETVLAVHTLTDGLVTDSQCFSSMADVELDGGTQYLIEAGDAFGYDVDFVLTFREAVRPVNDDRVDAITIGLPSSTFGSNRLATREDGEVTRFGTTVWYSVMPTEEQLGGPTGMVTIDTSGSSFDTYLDLFDGADRIAFDDDSYGSNALSLIEIVMTAGTTYDIAVSGYSDSEGDFVLNLTAGTVDRDVPAQVRAVTLGDPTLSESAGAVPVIRLSRTYYDEQDSVIGYQVTPAGSTDFTLAVDGVVLEDEGTLTFGGIGRDVVLTPTDDTVVEADLDVTLTISSTDTTTVLAPTSQTITILDDDTTPAPAPAAPPVGPAPAQSRSFRVVSPGTDPTDNSETARKLSQLANPGPEPTFAQTGGEVLLASETVFADALASGSLQGDRTLLLNDPDELESEVLAEIQRLGATTVRILGGEAAISAAVSEALTAEGITVERTAGASRLETAAAIAQLVPADGGFLARAFRSVDATDETQAFADSLALGGWAAALGQPVLLTQTDVLSATTRDHLDSSTLEQLRVIGGQAAISQATADAAAELVTTLDRVSGPDRAATAVAIAQARGFAAKSKATSIIVIEGQAANSWAAGFSAARLSALRDAPVLMLNGDDVPAETAEFISTSVDADAGVVCSASPAACDAVLALLNEL